MAHTYYIKDFDNEQIKLYFFNVPLHVIRTQLKSNGWLWNTHELYWYARLTQQHEKFAKKLGAIDGTAPNSNPTTAAGTMDIQSIRNSMVAIFKNPVFASYSLQQIQDYLDSLSNGSPKMINVDTHGVALAGIVLMNPVHFEMETVMITGEPTRANEYNRAYCEDSQFAQTLLRCISFQRPYLLYKSAVYGIAGISDNTYMQKLISHTRNLNSPDSYVDVWVYRLKRPCQHHGVQSVTAYIPSERSLTEQPINTGRLQNNSDCHISACEVIALPIFQHGRKNPFCTTWVTMSTPPRTSLLQTGMPFLNMP